MYDGSNRINLYSCYRELVGLYRPLRHPPNPCRHSVGTFLERCCMDRQTAADVTE